MFRRTPSWLQRVLGRTSREAAALRAAAAIAAAATPINDPLQRILEAALPVVPADHLVLLRAGPDRIAIVVAAAGSARVWRWLRAPLGEGVVTETIDTGTAHVTPALLVVPVVLDGTVIGALETANERERRFTPHDAELLRAFADQCAIAVSTARTGRS